MSSGTSRELCPASLPAALRVKLRWSVSHSMIGVRSVLRGGKPGHSTLTLGNSSSEVTSKPSNGPGADESLSTVGNHVAILGCPDEPVSFQRRHGFVNRAPTPHVTLEVQP